MHRLFLILCTIVIVSAQTYRMGIAPWNKTEKLKLEFEPLQSYLKNEFNLEIQLEYTKTIDECIENMASGKYDIAFMSPSAFLQARHISPEIDPLLAAINVVSQKSYFRTYIVTQEGNSIHTLNDLNGKRVIYVQKETLTTHLIPKYLYQHFQISPGQTTYVSSPKVGLEAFLNGEADAYGIHEGRLKELEGKIKVLTRSFPIPEYTICTNTGSVPLQVRETLKHAIQSLPSSSEIISSISSYYIGFEPKNVSEYKALYDLVKYFKYNSNSKTIATSSPVHK